MSTPSGSSAPRIARSRRNGRRRQASRPAAVAMRPDERREDAVAVLDDRVGLQRRDRAAVALGPVGAAEARAGEAHRRRPRGRSPTARRGPPWRRGRTAAGSARCCLMRESTALKGCRTRGERAWPAILAAWRSSRPPTLLPGRSRSRSGSGCCSAPSASGARDAGPTAGRPGVRTFALVALLGALSAEIGDTAVIVLCGAFVGFATLAALPAQPRGGPRHHDRGRADGRLPAGRAHRQGPRARGRHRRRRGDRARVALAPARARARHAVRAGAPRRAAVRRGRADRAAARSPTRASGRTTRSTR